MACINQQKANPMPNLPTPADEALARKLRERFMKGGVKGIFILSEAEAAQLIAAHVAAQAPSGLVEAVVAFDRARNARIKAQDDYSENRGNIVEVAKAETLEADAMCAVRAAINAAHKAQPVADVRGMVEVLDEVAKHLRMDDDVISALRVIDAALASARHAMGGEAKA